MPTVTFHGTRGSCPCSGPEFRRHGGATACVSVEADTGGPPVVFDLGTGSRPLGEQVVADHLPAAPILGAPLEPARPIERALPTMALSCFVSHLHFDHVQGLPFFLPALREEVRIDLYAPAQQGPPLAEAVAAFIRPPYFPVCLEDLPAEILLHELADGALVDLGPAGSLLAREVPHRGPTLGYRLSTGGSVVAYLSDHQAPLQGSGPVADSVLELVDGADLLIHDAQYTREEFEAKAHWGHSTLAYAVEVAKTAGARRLALFHHDPTHDDDELDRLGEEAARLAGNLLEVLVAADGLSLNVGSSGAVQGATRTGLSPA